jgi:hypothetical protein
MTAKPTDGLLVCLAAVRAGNLDLGIIKRAFGDDASLSENPTKVDSLGGNYVMTSSFSVTSDQVGFHGDAAWHVN